MIVLIALNCFSADAAMVILENGPENPVGYYCGERTNVLLCQLSLKSQRYVFGNNVYGFIQYVVRIKRPDPYADHGVTGLTMTDENGTVIGYPTIVGRQYWNGGTGYFFTFRAEPTLKPDAFSINPTKPTLINIRATLGDGFETYDKVEVEWSGTDMYNFEVEGESYCPGGLAHGDLTIISKKAHIQSLTTDGTNVFLHAYGKSRCLYRVQFSFSMKEWLNEGVEIIAPETGEMTLKLPLDSSVRSRSYRLVTD